MCKKIFFPILIAVSVILALVIAVFLIDKAKNDDKLKNKSIKNISLIYRYSNYAWGAQDYAYLIDS